MNLPRADALCPPVDLFTASPGRVSVRPGGAGPIRVAGPDRPLTLEGGGVLEHAEIAVETFGTLNADGTNAVLVCPCLTADARVIRRRDADHPGWWEALIGPGKPIDTDRFFVIGSNPLGGCAGSTGPTAIDGETGEPYADRFPHVTIGDIAEAQVRVLDALGISAPAAVAGGSIGGFQALDLIRRWPDRFHTAMVLAAGPRLGSFGLAFNAAARRAILSDPEFRGGRYRAGEGPRAGLALARQIAHLTYRAAEAFDRRFGRSTADAGRDGRPAFAVEAYLDRKGEQFVERFDANSYLRLIGAMDRYELGGAGLPLDSAFAGVRAELLLGGFSSDWLFPPPQTLELASAARAAGVRVHTDIAETGEGHDAFLIAGTGVEVFGERFASRASINAGLEPSA
jgi:homoserine O-acetyltransferase